MSFLKSLVKEVNVAKSMFDIPVLKQERDDLQKQLDKCVTEISKLDALVEESAGISEAVANLQKYSKYLDTEEEQTAQQIYKKLLHHVESSQTKLAECKKKHANLQHKMESVNDKLKKARANVK